jgi:hypothetical protein
MSHANAPLTPEGRRRACEQVDRDRPISHVAAEFHIARQTLGKWHARWLAEGEDGLVDHSSRPVSSPGQTPLEVEDLIEKLRRKHKVGPVQLAGKLAKLGHHVPASTIYQVLVRRGINRLADIAPDGGDLREPVRRYEWAGAGDMVHVDVKKVGRIPAGGGWWAHGRGSAQDKAARKQRVGYVYLHSATDDHTRLTYTEELDDEKGITAAGFWIRAARWFVRHGITKISRVLTDNGSCYRSLVFATALASTRTRHKRTRPYRPQTNGKVERYHRTMATEWIYVQTWESNEQRKQALAGWLDYYNYDRPHTALGGKPPISRCPIDVNNLAA